MLPPVKQPENPLFTQGSNFNMNACVGDNGGPYNWFNYADGFFRGGHAAIASAKEYADPVDIMIYPAAFAYRHGIELMLKQMIELLGEILGESVQPKRSHSMIDLWKVVEQTSAKVTEKQELIAPEALARIGELVGYFNDIDPTGQVFRYPEDNKGSQHLKEMAIINVEVLEGQMRELHSIFSQWYEAANEWSFYMAEARGEFVEGD